MEDAVPADLPRDVPEKQAEDDPAGPHHRPAGNERHHRVPTRERRGASRRDQEQDERKGQRGVDEEDDAHRAEDRSETPRERRGRAPNSECA